MAYPCNKPEHSFRIWPSGKLVESLLAERYSVNRSWSGGLFEDVEARPPDRYDDDVVTEQGHIRKGF